MDMRVNPIMNTAAIARQKSVYAKQQTGGTQTAAASDKVELSSTSRIFSAAIRAAKNVPDVRTEKIEALRSAIQNGTYSVSSTDVAEKMLSGAGLTL